MAVSLRAYQRLAPEFDDEVSVLTNVCRVFRAVNFEEHRVAACKVIYITEQTSDKDRKNWDKEMRVSEFSGSV